MATDSHTTSRRALLAAGAAVPALALPVAAGAVPNPDAEMIAEVHDFIDFHYALETALRPLISKPNDQWTAEDEALSESANASETGYHEDLGEVCAWQPATLAGLAAKALAVLWANQDPSDTQECLAWTFAIDLLRLAGEPLPDWVKKGRYAEGYLA